MKQVENNIIKQEEIMGNSHRQIRKINDVEICNHDFKFNFPSEPFTYYQELWVKNDEHKFDACLGPEIKLDEVEGKPSTLFFIYRYSPFDTGFFEDFDDIKFMTKKEVMNQIKKLQNAGYNTAREVLNYDFY